MQNWHSTTSERSWTDSASWPTWARVTPRRRWRAWSGARSACRFRACAWAPPRPATPLAADDAWIFFEVQGAMGGALVLRLPGSARQLLVGELVGADAGTAHAESALREVGNILASHALSAVADLVGTRVLPSLPSLVFDATGPALAAWRSRAAGRVCIETHLVDDAGLQHVELVWIPSEVPGEAARGPF